MDKAKRHRSRVQWAEVCTDSEYKGHWVALDDVRYEAGNPVEGEIVDWDDDLAALCSRVQAADSQSCAIMFCDDGASGIRRAMSF